MKTGPAAMLSRTSQLVDGSEAGAAGKKVNGAVISTAAFVSMPALPKSSCAAGFATSRPARLVGDHDLNTFLVRADPVAPADAQYSRG
jgi:hypothetical protein